MRFAPSFVHLYIQTLPKFQNLPKLKSTNKPLFISILALTYSHISFVLCSSFLRHLFVICSSFVRSLFVLCSFFVRLLFVFCLSARAARIVFCSSHFSVTTLPLLGRGLGRGYFVRLLFVFCSSFVCLSYKLSISFSQINH